MKKAFICMLTIFLMSGCAVEPENMADNLNTTPNKIDQHFQETFDSTLVTAKTENTNEINTTMSVVSEKVIFQNAVINELKQNVEIIGGMCVDLNFDGFPEVIFTLDSPEDNMYSIYNYQGESLVCVGTFFDWLNLCNDDISHPELKLYKNKLSDDYFYYVEKCFGIKDVTSALHIEAIVYGVDNTLYELTIMLYKNADTSDKMKNEMKGVLERTRKYIETNNDLVKIIPIEIQWTLNDLEGLYES